MRAPLDSHDLFDCALCFWMHEAFFEGEVASNATRMIAALMYWNPFLRVPAEARRRSGVAAAPAMAPA